MVSLHRYKTSASNMEKFWFRCYAYNDHLTLNCTKPRDYKMCSECSSNHIWRSCQSLTKKCINCSEDHKTLSNQCPKVKTIQQQQFQINRSVSSSALTPVNHPTHVNLDSKILFANVVKRTVQYKQFTKDDAFKGFMSIMYASYVRSCSVDIFQKVLVHLLQKNEIQSLSIGDCPPLSPIGIPTTTSSAHSENNNTPFPGNSMTSQTHAALLEKKLKNFSQVY